MSPVGPGARVDLAPGVSVYGGYGPGFGQRDPVLFQSAITTTSPAQGPAWAVRCLGIQGSGAPTRLDGVTVLGANAERPGQSSYGVLSIGCDARLRVTYCQILAGDGATGTPGGSGANGAAGLPGKSGLPAKDIGEDSCIQSDAKHWRSARRSPLRLAGRFRRRGRQRRVPRHGPSSRTGMPSKPYLQTLPPANWGRKALAPGAESAVTRAQTATSTQTRARRPSARAASAAILALSPSCRAMAPRQPARRQRQPRQRRSRRPTPSRPASYPQAFGPQSPRAMAPAAAPAAAGAEAARPAV